MINEKELEQVKLSATKKDFYQIWNELIETAGKLSERWSPESTNESDPGIVLLKVLTAIADKLNYNIDKNTLEAFMPSAAQEESMRKLCDMMGYNMKYYQSATTDVTITYSGDTLIDDSESLKSTGVIIPAYTNIKNVDDDINYFTLEPITIDDTVNKTRVVQCMEGTVETCGDDTDGIISINQIDDNYRYYLPESQIAENGIFIYNVDDSKSSELWKKVDNLNTQKVGAQCFKFGFDSRLQMPYIQFPEDISTIIEDGLVIRYTRTNGVNGNISYNTLCKLEAPELWSNEKYSDAEAKAILNVDNFALKNAAAAVNGKNKESIDDAYNNYKKTIGTFDTLVTCRDYMNKIYQLTFDNENTTPLVSNVIVSDIRDDINKAITLCTFNDYGIAYVDKSKTIKTDRTVYAKTDTTKQNPITISENVAKITNFDLVLYPFTTISGTISKDSYKNSFRYTTDNNVLIKQDDNIEKFKTISHNWIDPETGDIACIKVYLKLNAKITTTTKVNLVEETAILKNIYAAIYENFNARKIDFGEEIPFDSILNVIENADSRIKNVSLDEPILYTKYHLVGKDEEPDSAVYYNKTALRNILAGRIALFDYDKTFKADYTEEKYHDTDYATIYPNDTRHIKRLESEFMANARDTSLKLNENEVIQFSAPNFKTEKTYPAYVNYFLHLENSEGVAGAPATFGTLESYLNGNGKFAGYGNKWESFAEAGNAGKLEFVKTTFDSKAKAQTAEYTYGAIFVKENNKYIKKDAATWTSAETEYYYFNITTSTFYSLDRWVKEQESKETDKKLLGLFKSLGSKQSYIPGKWIDENKVKYTAAEYQASTSQLTTYFIQVTHASDDPNNTYTADGCGRDATGGAIAANCEYELNDSEYLLINYTPSTSTDSTDSANETIETVNEVYKPGDIIRPNFELFDSKKYYLQGHTPSKKSGYNFDQQYKQAIDEIGGMYTLDTNEQIEIRKPVEVVLDQNTTNLYWERNDEDEHTSNNIVTFTFDEDDGLSYRLKEGEYIYYTDDSKIDLAYYGNGTKITRKSTSLNITKEKIDSEKLADAIANDGLLAALPWKKYNFSETGDNLTIKEYQYINLTKDDTLIRINKDSAIGFEFDIKKDWSTTKVTNATYKLADFDNETSLPKIVSTKDKYKWQVRSLLNINVGPSSKQTLHSTDLTTDTIKIVFDSGDAVSITPTKNSGQYEDLSIKTNFSYYSFDGLINAKRKVYDKLGELKEVYDTQLKIFKYNDIINSESKNKINLWNYGTGNWTKVSLDKDAPFSLNVMLPNNNSHGVMMFYYILNDKVTEITKEKCAYITVSDNKLIKICNAHGTLFDDNGWWNAFTEGTTSKKYYLRPGLNIIEIPSSCILTINKESTTDHGNLIFGELDIVNTITNDNKTYLKLNPYIDYQKVDTDALAEITAYKNIIEADPNYNFYYNAVIDNSIAINLNTDAGEKLSDPALFYDYNNINNKFVISEINADYLSSGIVLTNSSKR